MARSYAFVWRSRAVACDRGHRNAECDVVAEKRCAFDRRKPETTAAENADDRLLSWTGWPGRRLPRHQAPTPALTNSAFFVMAVTATAAVKMENPCALQP
jgi:hypothetical protein